MALKTFTPFAEGAEIKSADFNNTYKTSGLEGTIASIERDQFANEGFGLESFSTAVSGFTGSPGEGAGNPYYIRLTPAQVTNDFINQGTSAAFVESTSGNDISIDLNSSACDVLQLGDIILIEFVGQISCVQFGTDNFSTVARVTSLETASINAGTDKHQEYFAELGIKQSVSGGGFSSPAATLHCDHKFSPWCRWGTSTTTSNVSVTTGDATYTGPCNVGIGAYQTFHITAAYAVTGSETALSFKVSADPNAGTGSQGSVVANPALRIRAGSTLFAKVLRRSIA